jgi:hypothetical protein
MKLLDPNNSFDPEEKYPFVCGKITSFEAINKNVEVLIKNNITNYDERTIKIFCNLHAKRTDWFLHNEKSPEISAIKKCITDVVQQISPGKMLFEIKNMWGAVYEKDSYVIDHDHFGYIWSFVYTVKTFDGAPPLRFTASGKEIKLNEGEFIVFPSWINHFVNKQDHDLERIIVAGNINTV